MSEGNYLKSIYTNLSVQLETVSAIAAINSAQPWGEFCVNLSSIEILNMHVPVNISVPTGFDWLADAGFNIVIFSVEVQPISHMPTALTEAACWFYTAQRKPKFKHDRS